MKVLENKTMLILYGTQTGNAQDVAERMGREARRQGVRSRVFSMDSYKMEELSSESFIIFVAATTGQGECPSNMKKFWRFLLKRSHSSHWLAGTCYAVFGLGDSGYPKFNVVAKKLDRRMLDLGSKPLMPRGLGDDQHPSGYEAALDPWLVSLWSVLRNRLPLTAAVTDASLEGPPLDPPKFRVTFHKPSVASNGAANVNMEERKMEAIGRAVHMLDAATALASGSTSPADADSAGADGTIGAFGPWRPFAAKLLCNRRLTSVDHFQDVRHVELDVRGANLPYSPGDVLYTLPEQSPDEVRKFLHRCNLDPNAWLTVEPASDASHGDENDGADAVDQRSATFDPVNLATLVAWALDFSSASPRRYFFEVLSHFASEAREAERLQYFATADGRDDLYRYNGREGRTVAEILDDFPSVSLPLPWLLQIVPRLKPRAYSISSSPKAHPGEVHLTAALVQWTTPFKRERRGLCSRWLAGLSGDAFLPIWVSRGALGLPPPHVPLILIGPGTGCAPFRSFIHERAAMEPQETATEGGQECAPILFFFGCRNEAKDFLYGDEWKSFSEAGLLSEGRGGGFFVAFSRDQSQKEYVQHKIRENSAKVWEMLINRAAVFVAGSASKMPADVTKALGDVLRIEGAMSDDEAAKWLKNLERFGKFSVEAWS